MIYPYISINYLFKNGFGSQVKVFKLQCCLSLPRTSETYYNELAELVQSFVCTCIVNAISPKGTSTIQGVSRSSRRSSSRSPPGVTTLPTDSGSARSEYCRSRCVTQCFCFFIKGFSSYSSSALRLRSRSSRYCQHYDID